MKFSILVLEDVVEILEPMKEHLKNILKFSYEVDTLKKYEEFEPRIQKNVYLAFSLDQQILIDGRVEMAQNILVEQILEKNLISFKVFFSGFDQNYQDSKELFQFWEKGKVKGVKEWAEKFASEINHLLETDAIFRFPAMVPETVRHYGRIADGGTFSDRMSAGQTLGALVRKAIEAVRQQHDLTLNAETVDAWLTKYDSTDLNDAMQELKDVKNGFIAGEYDADAAIEKSRTAMVMIVLHCNLFVETPVITWQNDRFIKIGLLPDYQELAHKVNENDAFKEGYFLLVGQHPISLKGYIQIEKAAGKQLVMTPKG